MTDSADRYHSFTRLVLTLDEPDLDGVRTEHCFELRSSDQGAEVWRSSAVLSGDDRVDSEQRFVGALTTRQVIELLTEIERSGVYEALPALGLVEGEALPVGDERPRVSLEVSSDSVTRELFDRAPADEDLVNDLVVVVRRAIALAQERALSWAG